MLHLNIPSSVHIFESAFPLTLPIVEALFTPSCHFTCVRLFKPSADCIAPLRQCTALTKLSLRVPQIPLDAVSQWQEILSLTRLKQLYIFCFEDEEGEEESLKEQYKRKVLPLLENAPFKITINRL